MQAEHRVMLATTQLAPQQILVTIDFSVSLRKAVIAVAAAPQHDQLSLHIRQHEFTAIDNLMKTLTFTMYALPCRRLSPRRRRWRSRMTRRRRCSRGRRRWR